MTKEQVELAIRSNLLDVAKSKYPNDPDRQMLYTIGFLQAQLAQACLMDSRVYQQFKRAVTYSKQ